MELYLHNVSKVHVDEGYDLDTVYVRHIKLIDSDDNELCELTLFSPYDSKQICVKLNTKLESPGECAGMTFDEQR